MKMIFRCVVFIAAVVLMFLHLTPLYKGVLHIGMIYPLPIFLVFAIFALKPDWLAKLIEKYRVITLCATCLFLVGMVVYSAMILMLCSFSKKTQVKNKTVVVLGCQVIGERPSLMLYDRMLTALDYIENNPDCYVLVSGGKGPGEEISEAQAMKTFFVRQGVAEERILLEDKSSNTEENIRFCAKIIKEQELENEIVVVTDTFHQYRAYEYSKRNNLVSYSYACNTKWYFACSYYSREVLAVFKLFLM